jgi:hypothetical protein
MQLLRLVLILAWCSTAALAIADNAPIDLGPARWQLTAENGAEAHLETFEDSGSPVLAVNVAKPGPEFWSIELRAANIPLQKGSTYELKFRAKSEPDTYVYFVLEKDFGDQASVAAGTNLAIPKDWTDCSVTFEVTEEANPGRLTISSLSVNPAKFWFSDFRFQAKH